jgi:hypothetical protein
MQNALAKDWERLNGKALGQSAHYISTNSVPLFWLDRSYCLEPENLF